MNERSPNSRASDNTHVAKNAQSRGSHTNSDKAQRGNNTIAENHKPRLTSTVTGEKLSVSGLFDLGDEIKVSEPAFEANAKACSSALNKLRKL